MKTRTHGQTWRLSVNHITELRGYRHSMARPPLILFRITAEPQACLPAQGWQLKEKHPLLPCGNRAANGGYSVGGIAVAPRFWGDRGAPAQKQGLKNRNVANVCKQWPVQALMEGNSPTPTPRNRPLSGAVWNPPTGSEAGGNATSKAWVNVSVPTSGPVLPAMGGRDSGGEAERRRGLGVVEALVGWWVQTERTTGRRLAQWARNKGLSGRDSARCLLTGSWAAHRGFSANQYPHRAVSVGFSSVPYSQRRGGGPRTAAPAAEGPRGPPRCSWWGWSSRNCGASSVTKVRRMELRNGPTPRRRVRSP